MTELSTEMEQRSLPRIYPKSKGIKNRLKKLKRPKQKKLKKYTPRYSVVKKGWEAIRY